MESCNSQPLLSLVLDILKVLSVEERGLPHCKDAEGIEWQGLAVAPLSERQIRDGLRHCLEIVWASI